MAEFNKGNYPDAMATGEADFYKYFRRLLSMAGVAINVEGSARTTANIPYQDGAKVVLMPEFAVTIQEVLDKVSGGSITDKSALVLDGKNIRLTNVQLDGALIIRVADGVELEVKGLIVQNDGAKFVDMTAEEMADPSSYSKGLKMRGYRLVMSDVKLIEIKEPGKYVVGSDGVKIGRASCRERVCQYV